MPIFTSAQFNLGFPLVRSSVSSAVKLKSETGTAKFYNESSNINSITTFSLNNKTTNNSNSFSLLALSDVTTSQTIISDLEVSSNIILNLQNTENIQGSFLLNLEQEKRNHTSLNLLYAYSVVAINSPELIEYKGPISSKIKETINFTLTASNSITTSSQLSQTDDLPPEIINTSPASGSFMNDPLQDLYFRLQDNATTSITTSSINIFINNTQFIQNGNIIHPNTFLTQISLREFDFLYTNPSGFPFGSEVIVSGSAKDVLNNSGIFSYNYSVWDIEDLSVIISGAPDINPPYIIDTFPVNLSTGNSVNTNIKFNIKDDHTGLDINTLKVSVDSEVVISGLDLNTDYATYEFNKSPNNRELEVIINPKTFLEFGQLVNIDISIGDLFTPSNLFSGSFNFTTEVNSYLLVSGLHIFSENNFVPFDVSDLYNSESPTKFFVDYINTSGTGVARPESKVIKNGQIIPSTFVPISGSDSYYRVYFQLNPDYEMLTLLNFYIQAEGVELSLGSQFDLNAQIIGLETGSNYNLGAEIIPNIFLLDLIASITSSKDLIDLNATYTPRTDFIFRNFSRELLWGYEVCVSGIKLPYESTVDVDFLTTNQSCTPKYSNYATNLYTVPFPNYDLNAEIVGEGFNYMTLSGYIESNNPFFEYGKTMNLVLEAQDFAGNKLEFSWSFTIEDEDNNG